MPTFITLLQRTQKGIENVKEGPSRSTKLERP